MSKLSLIRRVVPKEVQQKLARQALKLEKHSPHILFGAGLVGFGATVVLASSATLKVEGVLSELDEKRAEINEARDIVPKYSDDDYNQDLVYIYVRAGYELTKLYAPAVLIGAASVACLTKSHTILTGRNAALTAAYAGLDKMFAEYRKRVEDEFGPEKEQDLADGVRTISFRDSQTGEVETVKRRDPNAFSMYARFFDETNKNWLNSAEYNLAFLKAQQQYANDLLTARGHLFLNEVYDALGLEHSGAGAVVGWILDGEGDDYVDFGLFRSDRDRVRSFINGGEPSILLDFNVNGTIYDKI